MLSLSPGSATLASQEQLQFTARVSGTPNTAVTWSVSAGTISSSGFFTAPKVTTSVPVVITATSTQLAGHRAIIRDTVAANANSHASATVTVVPRASLAIATSALPAADASIPYSASLSATGGVTPYHWSFATGPCPPECSCKPPAASSRDDSVDRDHIPSTAKVTDASGTQCHSRSQHTISVKFGERI